MTNYVGKQFGNYQLLQCIGNGNFADVYLGEHQHLRTRAAIKILHARLSGDQVAQFRSEAQMIAHLAHPHIIRVLDYGVERGLPYLVMELADGGTLRQCHPHGTQVPLSSVVFYVKQIADALQYAHQVKLVHRDLKPENMLLRSDEEVVLSDFDLAPIVYSSNSVNKQDIAGTIAYMAPEQIREYAIPASDQYALAVIAYEWLSGELPFSGTFAEIAVKHCLVPPPSLSSKIAGLPRAVEQTINKALSKNPADRFGSVEAFALALEQAAFPALSRLSGRRLSPHTDSTAIVKPSATPVSPVPHSPQQQVMPGSLAILQKNLPSTDPVQPAFRVPNSGGQDNLYATSPIDTTLLVNRTSVGKAPSPLRFTRRSILIGSCIGLSLMGGGVTAMAQKFPSFFTSSAINVPALPQGNISLGKTMNIFRGHQQSVNDVTWSPDGKRIASASNDKTVQVWDAATGEHVLVYREHTDQIGAVAWSRDGKYLASGALDTAVLLWDAQTGQTIFRFPGHYTSVNQIRWSPVNSTRIASCAHEIKLWDAQTGKHVVRYDFAQTSGTVDLYVPESSWSPDGKRIVSSLKNYPRQTMQDPNHKVEVWDAATAQRLFSYTGHNGYAVSSVSWSPDGRFIATGGADKTVQIWDAVSGKTFLVYKDHQEMVFVVRWSPDGRHIASSGDSAAIHLWDAQSGKIKMIYKAHAATINNLSWSPDGRYIASVSLDKTVHVWRAS